MKTANRTKTVTILLLAAFLAAVLCLSFLYRAQTKASEASLYGREGEVVAYAAAFACLEENEGKSKGEMIEKAQEYIDARNALMAETEDMRLREWDREYRVDQLPVLYYSLEELRGGIEESLEILDDFSHMYDDGAKPETKGYTREDFDRLCDERIAAEREVLEKLNADNNPDLYTYSTMLYQARISHEVVT